MRFEFWNTRRTPILAATVLLVAWVPLSLNSWAQDETPSVEKQENQAGENQEELLTEDDLTDADLGIDDLAEINDLAELQKKWSEIDSKLNEVQSKFKSTSDVAEQQKIRSEYQGLIDRANQIVGRIKDVAVEDCKKDPNNRLAIKMLMGTLVNDASFSVNADQRQRASDVIKIGDQMIAAGIDNKYFEKAAKLDRLPIAAREIFEELLIRHRESAADDLPRVKISTSKGDMVVELFENEAPNTVANFISLVEKKFYDGLTFHRVMEDFMAQGGCPQGDGTSGPGYKIKCECDSPDARRHFLGSISMAHAGKDSGGSQFFIMFGRPQNPGLLDGKHTVFGKVIEGVDVLASITRTHNQADQKMDGVEADKITSMEVLRKREHDYKPVKVGDPDPESPPADPTTNTDENTSSDGASDDSDDGK